MILCSIEKAFCDEVNHGQQEYDNGYLIDAVHDFDIHVDGPVRILLAKEIATHFSQ